MSAPRPLNPYRASVCDMRRKDIKSFLIWYHIARKIIEIIEARKERKSILSHRSFVSGAEGLPS